MTKLLAGGTSGAGMALRITSLVGLVGLIPAVGGCSSAAPIPPQIEARSVATSSPSARVGAQPFAEMAPTESRGGARADAYAIGQYRLGAPIGAFAKSYPDLWTWRHRAGHPDKDNFGIGIGARWVMPEDPLRGARLTFFGRAPADKDDDESFVPTVVVVLGASAEELVTPRLPDPNAEEAAVVSVDIHVAPGNPKSKRPRPAVVRFRCSTPSVCTIGADAQFVGSAFGDIPKDAHARFYKGIESLVVKYLDLHRIEED